MEALDLLRAVFGFVYVLFIPGFVATWALFPARAEISDVERLALSMGLSIALSTIPVMALNYAGVPVNSVNAFLIILAVILSCALAYYLRARNAT
jgi:uncharacterized membrane protein